MPATPKLAAFHELDPTFSVARLVGKFRNGPKEPQPMLPPFIIDQIRRREEEERRRQELEQPRLELPDHVYEPARERQEDEPERGVVILELR
jgi:hypothetical protein